MKKAKAEDEDQDCNSDNEQQKAVTWPRFLNRNTIKNINLNKIIINVSGIAQTMQTASTLLSRTLDAF